MGMINQLDFFKYQHEGEAQTGGERYLNEGEGEEIKFFGIYLHKDHLERKRDRTEEGKKIAQIKLRAFGAGQKIQPAYSQYHSD